MLTVYSKAACPFCDQAKNLLKKYGVAFEEVRVDLDPAARQFIMDAGHRTVPQLYKDGKIFVEGGYQGLSKLNEDQIWERVNAII
jgi:glutaredoxin